MTNNIKKHEGGCHCGSVRFTAEVDASKGTRCNCTVCTKIGQAGAIVKPHQLVLTKGEDALSTYVWGAKIGTRYFCKHCGVHCFGRGHLAELGGDYASINLLTLDDIDPSQIAFIHWDGRHDNWQAGPRDTAWPVAATVRS